MPKFLLEVFVSKTEIAASVSRELKKKNIRKLGSRVYTTNLKERPEVLIKRHAWLIVEELFPGAVIVDRTALEHRPAEDGSIFVVSKKKRPVVLPGITIYPRKGQGPLAEDKPFMEGLFLSCPARAYLENMRETRSRKGHAARTLSRKEIEEKLEAILRSAGPDALQNLRDEARRICSILHAEKEYKALDALIGALLGTRKTHLISEAAKARSLGKPYDPKRLDLFQALYAALATTSTEIRTIGHTSAALPFFESYFSNFIEGTEFEVEEAAKIIFEGRIPTNRPADAHDIIGTYQIVSSDREMKKIPGNADEMIDILKDRHAQLMQGRPEMHPGQFKRNPNRAGSSFFVAPDLVEGTLRQGFKWFQGLDTPFKRAVYMMFLIAEVHPFDDGNGRCARIMMNAELAAANQARIIVPTIFRNTYLSALRALTRNGQPTPLIRALDFAQNYTARIDWSGIKAAQKMLTETHAFDDAAQAELTGVRLKLP